MSACSLYVWGGGSPTVLVALEDVRRGNQRMGQWLVVAVMLFSPASISPLGTRGAMAMDKLVAATATFWDTF